MSVEVKVNAGSYICEYCAGTGGDDMNCPICKNVLTRYWSFTGLSEFYVCQRCHTLCEYVSGECSNGGC